MNESVLEMIDYLIDRYGINISTQNYIVNKLMRNVEKERLEAKLRLWETPGFSQFLEDLKYQLDNPIVLEATLVIKLMYQHDLQELKEKETKFKQGKLDL